MGSPFLLAPGDGLRFVPVDEGTFDAIAAEIEASRYLAEVEG
jgi:allophanate hydrolase subunit 1